MVIEGPARQRLFCAVEVPAVVRGEVGQYVARLRALFPRANVRWESAERWHITLKFFGAVENGRATALREEIAAAVDGVAAFRLGLAGGGVFPPRGAPRVLWLGVRTGAAELQELQERLEKRCAPLGFGRETRRFHPHLTIARLKNASHSAEDETRPLARHHSAARFISAPRTAREVILMQSELRPGGSLYTPVSRYALVDDSR